MREGVEHGVSLFKKNKSKLIAIAIIVVLLLVTVLAIFFKGYTSAKEKSEQKIAELEAEIERLSSPVATYEEASREIDISVINTEIQGIGELATLEYLYTDAGKFSDPKQLFGYDIPLTTKSFIAKWDGSIKAGVKVEKITAEVKKASKEIVVYIPKAEILSHEIDDESFETLDEKDNIFNPLEIDDIREFDSKSKEAMEKRAIENGILDKATENAKDIISKLIYDDVIEELEYNIVFEVIEE